MDKNLLNIRLRRTDTLLRKTIATLDNVSVNAVLLEQKPSALLRLLNLEVWAARFGVPYAFVLQTLRQPYLRPRKGHRHRPGTLGAPVNSITGQAAYNRLQEAIIKNHPDNHPGDREKNIALKPISAQNPTDYQRKAETARRLLNRRLRSSRPWRGNPWQ